MSEGQENKAVIRTPDQRLVNGDLTPSIVRRYGLADAPQAHRDLASRRTTGKLLLLP